jgi:hypothetical protein
MAKTGSANPGILLTGSVRLAEPEAGSTEIVRPQE